MKPSQPLMARLRLTTKQVNGGYYKGNRTGSMGFFTRKGRYVVDYRKVRTYVVPENLDSFNLTPFVTKSFLPTPTKYTRSRRNLPRAFDAIDYLTLWKDRNIEEVQKYLSEEQKEQEAKTKEKERGTETTTSEEESPRAQ